MDNFWIIFGIVFLAEIPCILRTMSIQLYSNDIWKVVTGTLAGSISALLVGLMLAKIFSLTVPAKYIEYIHPFAAIILILAGIFMFTHHD